MLKKCKRSLRMIPYRIGQFSQKILKIVCRQESRRTADLVEVKNIVGSFVLYRVAFKEWPPYSAGKCAFFEVYHTLLDIITPNNPILVKNEL